MKIAYYPDTDSMYIDLTLRDSIESKEVSPGVVLDYDPNGNITGYRHSYRDPFRFLIQSNFQHLNPECR
jgi:hypothetical protein